MSGLLLLRKRNKRRIDFKVCRAKEKGKSRKVSRLVDKLVKAGVNSLLLNRIILKEKQREQVG